MMLIQRGKVLIAEIMKVFKLIKGLNLRSSNKVLFKQKQTKIDLLKNQSLFV